MSAPARTRTERGAARRAAPARAHPRKRPQTGERPRPASTGWTRPKLVATRAPQAVARTGPRRAPFVLLVAGLLIGGLCSLLALNTAAAAEELRRNALSQSNADLADDVQQLEAQLAASQAPAALASNAARLGMVPAGNPAFLSIQPDGSVKVLGDPQPATAPPQPATAKPKPATHATPKPAKKAAKKPTKPTTTKPPIKPASTHPTIATTPLAGGTR